VIGMDIKFRLDKTVYDAREYFTSIYYTFFITVILTVEGRKFVKQYECRYYLELEPTVADGWENAVVQDNKKIIYHQPGFRGMIGTNNTKYEPLILKKLFDYIDTLNSVILQEEERNKPIITDISFKKRDYKGQLPDHDYDVTFTLNDGHSYTAQFSDSLYEGFEIFSMKKKLPSGKEKEFSYPTYYFRDHIYEQMFELLLKHSTERLRLLGKREKKYRKNTFVPSQYPLDTVNVRILT
jgi:hypothetical protein